jgi:hypothetical protein
MEAAYLRPELADTAQQEMQDTYLKKGGSESEVPVAAPPEAPPESGAMAENPAPAPAPPPAAGPSMVRSAQAAEIPAETDPTMMSAQERANRAMKLYDPGMGDRRAAGPAPVRQKPPAQVAAEDRARFEQEVFKQIGGDPFGRNTMAEITEHTKNDLPQLFQRAFGGQVIWEDRNRLDKNQNAFWQNEVKAYRAHLKNEIEGEKKSQVESYKQMMGRFDVEMKSQQAEQAQLQKRAEAFAGNQEKKVTSAYKRIEDLKKEERTLVGGISRIMKAGKTPGGTELPEYLEEMKTLKKQLEENRQEKEQIRMAVDPTYKRQVMLKREEEAAGAGKRAEKEKVANEAKSVEEKENRKIIASHPHESKGMPVSALAIPGGGVRVTYKDGSTEDRPPNYKPPEKRQTFRGGDVHGQAVFDQ